VKQGERYSHKGEKHMSNLLLKLDLQFFSADGGGEFGAYDPSSAFEGIGAEPVQPEGQGQVPYTEPQQPELLDFGGRKLQANEDLMGLHKDFTEQQRYITSLQEQVNAYKQLAQTVQTPPQVQPQAQPQEISSNVNEWNEETWQQFYDKPQEVIGQLIQQNVQSYIEPIMKERQWNDEIQRMYSSYPDFDQYIGDIQGLVQQFPDKYANGGLEDAYYRAKATKAADPAALAQDPQFLQQYVMNNPQVQQQAVGQYFQQKQQVNQQIPAAMGRGMGGSTPLTPDASPTTLREASRQFLKQLGIR
jgi:hypothetical protein